MVKCPYREENKEKFSQENEEELECSKCPLAEQDWDLDRLFKDLKEAKFACETLDLGNKNKNKNKNKEINQIEWKKIRYEYEELFNKFKGLNARERCETTLFLRGYDPNDIADHLRIDAKDKGRSQRSRGLNMWVSLITRRKVQDWAQIPLYLEHNDQASYRKNHQVESKSVSEQEVEITLKISKEELAAKGLSLDEFKEKLANLGIEVEF